MIAAAFIPEWARTRMRWYIVVFNVANFVGPAIAARAAFDALAGPADTDWALGALAVAERIRVTVERSEPEQGIKVTVSVGAVGHRGAGMSSEELIALADRAAYRAKFSGRNAVAIPPEGDPVNEAERVLLDAARE